MSIYVQLILAALWLFGVYGLFEKAGRKGWEALVPGYNFWIWLKVIEKPWWWILLLIFPGVNLLMLMVMSFNLAYGFNKRSTLDGTLAFLLPFFYLPYLATQKDLKMVGFEAQKKKGNIVIEWRDAIVFAIVAASIIRTYVFEAYTIPTPSMEKTLLVGDYLFVSKMAYGPKTPETPLAIPFVHHTIPVLNTKSYLEWISLPMYRLPGYDKINRNDVVVFNFPAGDTVILEDQQSSFQDQVAMVAQSMKNADLGRGKNRPLDSYMNSASKYLKGKPDLNIVTRPVDKRENYVKRCVAVPGDKLEIVNGILSINDELAYVPPFMQYNYYVFSDKLLNGKVLKEKYNINRKAVQDSKKQGASSLPFTFESREKFSQEMKMVAPLKPAIDEQYSEFGAKRNFPNDVNYRWNRDNFGPIVIPKKGETVELNPENISLYRRIIGTYEGNELVVKNGSIFINGEVATSYTFQMDYYFMMGDNRHNSLDSRFWGFVPEDHIVGRASFIWMSMDPELGWTEGKIRWERIFSWID